MWSLRDLAESGLVAVWVRLRELEPACGFKHLDALFHLFGLVAKRATQEAQQLEAAMQVGLMQPSGGRASVVGLDVRTEMQRIYGVMGVCPQVRTPRPWRGKCCNLL